MTQNARQQASRFTEQGPLTTKVPNRSSVAETDVQISAWARHAGASNGFAEGGYSLRENEDVSLAEVRWSFV